VGVKDRSRSLLLLAWLALSALLVTVDYWAQPTIQFPVLFILPVLLATWFNGFSWGAAFAIILASARIAFRLVGHLVVPWSLLDSYLNAGMRLAVFLLVAYMAHRLQGQRQLLSRRLDRVLETLPVGVWITDREGRIVSGNPAGMTIWGGARLVGVEGYGEYRGWWADSGRPITAEEWALARAIRKGETSVGELVEIEGFDGQRRTILNSAAPIHDEKGGLLGAVVVNQDVSDSQRLVREREDLLRELQDTLAQVKTLRGLIPICASCKSIRNDEGYWMRLEAYLQQRSDAEFSHGICPDCYRRLYPDYA